jgi:Ca2+-transporting ATPase
LGRRIYRNIRNAMRYIISVHVPTVGMVFLPLALGWPLVLFPVHVVFLEFIIDPACSIVFEAESSGDAQAMSQPPRDPAQPLFDARMVTASVLVGVAVLIAVVLAYGWALTQGRSEGAARALAFAAIVYGNLALIIINRSVYVAPVAALFRFESLALHDQLIALAAGVAGVFAVEVVKRMRLPSRAL